MSGPAEKDILEWGCLHEVLYFSALNLVTWGRWGFFLVHIINVSLSQRLL